MIRLACEYEIRRVKAGVRVSRVGAIEMIANSYPSEDIEMKILSVR